MDELSRRDVVKIASGGLLAAGAVIALGQGSNVEAQDNRTAQAGRGGLGGTTAKIDGIVLPQGLGSRLGGSPEDAAKAFMRAASQGLAVVVANALVSAVGSAVGNLGAGEAPPDWTKLVKGCMLNMIWDSPAKTALESTTAQSLGGAANALGGVSVSVGVSATF